MSKAFNRYIVTTRRAQQGSPITESAAPFDIETRGGMIGLLDTYRGEFETENLLSISICRFMYWPRILPLLEKRQFTTFSKPCFRVVSQALRPVDGSTAWEDNENRQISYVEAIHKAAEVVRRSQDSLSLDPHIMQTTIIGPLGNVAWNYLLEHQPSGKGG